MIESIDTGRVRHVLDGLVEQSVVRCDPAVADRSFTLVVRWPNPAIGADVAFARFAFEGVRDLQVLGRDLRGPGTLDGERSLVMAPTFAPDGVRGTAMGLAFHGGRRVGGVAFGYASVLATVRHARVVRDGERAELLDLESGVALTWGDPFGG